MIETLNSFMQWQHKGRETNKIEGLWDSDGVWCEDQKKVEEIILDYFSLIYRSEQSEFHEPSLEALSTRISPEMNALLLEDFKAEEVRTALWQMHPIKSSGPNGMSPINIGV